MKNNLTLIVTIYNQEISKLEFWLNFYKKFSKKININFIIDNPSYDSIGFLSEKIHNSDLFINDKNVGKFLSIYNHVKKGNVKGSHFKVCDPDDYVSFRNIKKLPKLHKEYIYILNRSNHTKKPNEISEKNIKFEIDRTSKIPDLSFANHITIIPTQSIMNDKNINTKQRIDASDDKLLGNISFLNGAIIKRIENSFYYYVSYNGNTSEENLEIYARNLEKTYNLILNLYKKNVNISPPEDYNSLIKWLKNLEKKNNKIDNLIFLNLIKIISKIERMQNERNNI